MSQNLEEICEIIAQNNNTGFEYEIALFYSIKCHIGRDCVAISDAISKRQDSKKINEIAGCTDISCILHSIESNGLVIIDCTLETQNDSVGPADIVVVLSDAAKRTLYQGLSVKFNNTCTRNVSGRRFLSDDDITQLNGKLPEYTQRYIEDMTRNFGDIANWFRKRKRSNVTNEFVDLIRDAVIKNWAYVEDKVQLFEDLCQSSSVIPFWVYEYRSGAKKSSAKYATRLITNPLILDKRSIDQIGLQKHKTSSIGFYLGTNMIAKLQVKFNNGFVEKCKKKNPDFIIGNTEFSLGQPFSSWNFSVIE